MVAHPGECVGAAAVVPRHRYRGERNCSHRPGRGQPDQTTPLAEVPWQRRDGARASCPPPPPPAASGTTTPRCSTVAAVKYARRWPASPRRRAILTRGITLKFMNPVTGASVFPTLSYAAQLLRGGEETRRKRETASTMNVVIEGSDENRDRRPPVCMGKGRYLRGVELPVAVPYQHRVGRCGFLCGVGRTANERSGHIPPRGADATAQWRIRSPDASAWTMRYLNPDAAVRRPHRRGMVFIMVRT